MKKRNDLEFTITDPRMTRFWITLEQGVDLVVKALNETVGGEIFIPKIPSMKITDLARAIEPRCRFKIIGIRPGEKMHETLISEDEARKTRLFKGAYVIIAEYVDLKHIHGKYYKYRIPPEGFVYSSDKNKRWLSVSEIKSMIKRTRIE